MPSGHRLCVPSPPKNRLFIYPIFQSFPRSLFFPIKYRHHFSHVKQAKSYRIQFYAKERRIFLFSTLALSLTSHFFNHLELCAILLYLFLFFGMDASFLALLASTLAHGLHPLIFNRGKIIVYFSFTYHPLG